MDAVEKHFRRAKKSYDGDGDPLQDLGRLGVESLKLLTKATHLQLPKVSAGAKRYSILQNDVALSRPFLPGLLMSDPAEFQHRWNHLTEACEPLTRRITLPVDEVNRTLYTAVMGFCLCYDLWKPKSRKTPGTQFEILLGSVLGKLLPDFKRSKHVLLPGEAENVATDIVFEDPNTQRALVFPVKITTRERIVQPFAHQRILDSVFGSGQYRSLIVCVSEMQRDEQQGANEICVPGTIRLFQKHLAAVSGLYYLDPPHRYLQPDLSSLVHISSLGTLLTGDLATFVQDRSQTARGARIVTSSETTPALAADGTLDRYQTRHAGKRDGRKR